MEHTNELVLETEGSAKKGEDTQKGVLGVDIHLADVGDIDRDGYRWERWTRPTKRALDAVAAVRLVGQAVYDCPTLYLASSIHSLRRFAWRITKNCRWLGYEPEEMLQVVSRLPEHTSFSKMNPEIPITIGVFHEVDRALVTRRQPLMDFIDSPFRRRNLVIEDHCYMPIDRTRAIIDFLLSLNRETDIIALDTRTKDSEPPSQLLRPTSEVRSFFTDSESWQLSPKPVFESICTGFSRNPGGSDMCDERRNRRLVEIYAESGAAYGKTIMFVDCLEQGELLSEHLLELGYPHECYFPDHRDPHPVPASFVAGTTPLLLAAMDAAYCINVPDIESIIISRQIKSHELLSQMMETCVDGPPGTKVAEARIIQVCDERGETHQHEGWADYTLYLSGSNAAAIEDYHPYLPNVDRQSDKSRPIGWYVMHDIKFDDTRASSTTTTRVPVYDGQRQMFEALIQLLLRADRSRWSSVTGFDQEYLNALFKPAVSFEKLNSDHRGTLWSYIDAIASSIHRLGVNPVYYPATTTETVESASKAIFS